MGKASDFIATRLKAPGIKRTLFIAGVTLEPGVWFTCTGGPYWLSPEGMRVPLNDEGPFKFLQCDRKEDGRLFIHCYDTGGGHCLLNVGSQFTSKHLDTLINAPYQVTGLATIAQVEKAKAAKSKPRKGK